MTAKATTPEETAERERKIKKYVATNGKSQLVALLLALLFGPIGYLYASPLGGVILILITLALAAGGGVAAGLLGWFAAMILAPFSAASYNEKVRAQAELMLP
jgi:hypothetical protein